MKLRSGEFITSEVKLSKEWKWSREKVRNFLKFLQNEKMLTTEHTTKYTSISIVNWDLYQIEKHQNIQEENNEETSKKHQKNTINNTNNIYIILYKEYSEKLKGASWLDTIKLIGEAQGREEYQQMSPEEQNKLYGELMSIK